MSLCLERSSQFHASLPNSSLCQTRFCISSSVLEALADKRAHSGRDSRSWIVLPPHWPLWPPSHPASPVESL